MITHKIHVSLDVIDLEASVDFHRRFPGAEPAKLRPGYANFDIQNPPLKLALNAAGRCGRDRVRTVEASC